MPDPVKPIQIVPPAEKAHFFVQTVRIKPGEIHRLNLPPNRSNRTLHLLQVRGKTGFYSFTSPNPTAEEAAEVKEGEEPTGYADSCWPLGDQVQEMGSLTQLPALFFGNNGKAQITVKLRWGWLVF